MHIYVDMVYLYAYICIISTIACELMHVSTNEIVRAFTR